MNLPRSIRKSRRLPQTPRFDPRHVPRARDTAADHLGQVAQRARQPAGGISDENEAEQFHVRNEAGRPLRCGRLGGTQPISVGAGDENDTRRHPRWGTRPTVIGSKPVRHERGQARLTRTTVRSEPPQGRCLRAIVRRQLVDAIRGRNPTLRPDRACGEMPAQGQWVGISMD